MADLARARYGIRSERTESEECSKFNHVVSRSPCGPLSSTHTRVQRIGLFVVLHPTKDETSAGILVPNTDGAASEALAAYPITQGRVSVSALHPGNKLPTRTKCDASFFFFSN